MMGGALEEMSGIPKGPLRAGLQRALYLLERGWIENPPPLTHLVDLSFLVLCLQHLRGHVVESATAQVF